MVAPSLPFGIAPTQAQIQTALRNFLTTVLPSTVEVILAQANRAGEPTGRDFVVITPLRFERLRTNVDSSSDVHFTGNIVGNTLTVTEVLQGTVGIGQTVWGTGVVANQHITALVGGAGGTGTYTVSLAQTAPTQQMSGGAKIMQQNAKVTLQLDFHSENETNAGDYAQIVSTALRDPYGVDQFANQTPHYDVVPLYADDPRQMPFYNAEQQIEWRWVVEALLQANQVVTVPQQYSDSIDVLLVSVDAEFPPS